MGKYREANYENAIIELMSSNLNYTYLPKNDIKRDYEDPLYIDELLPALKRINKNLPQEAIKDAVNKLRDIENGDLIHKNMIFTDYLQNGVPVKYLKDGEERSNIVYLIDFKNINNNSFVISNQWAFKEFSKKIIDIVILINGLHNLSLY